MDPNEFYFWLVQLAGISDPSFIASMLPQLSPNQQAELFSILPEQTLLALRSASLSAIQQEGPAGAPSWQMAAPLATNIGFTQGGDLRQAGLASDWPGNPAAFDPGAEFFPLNDTTLQGQIAWAGNNPTPLEFGGPQQEPQLPHPGQGLPPTLSEFFDESWLQLPGEDPPQCTTGANPLTDDTVFNPQGLDLTQAGLAQDWPGNPAAFDPGVATARTGTKRSSETSGNTTEPARQRRRLEPLASSELSQSRAGSGVSGLIADFDQADVTSWFSTVPIAPSLHQALRNADLSAAREMLLDPRNHEELLIIAQESPGMLALISPLTQIFLDDREKLFIAALASALTVETSLDNWRAMADSRPAAVAHRLRMTLEQFNSQRAQYGIAHLLVVEQALQANVFLQAAKPQAEQGTVGPRPSARRGEPLGDTEWLDDEHIVADYELLATRSGLIARARAFTLADLWVYASPGTVGVSLVPAIPAKARGDADELVTAALLAEFSTDSARDQVVALLDERDRKSVV